MTRFQLVLLFGCLLLAGVAVRAEADEYEDVEDEPGEEKKEDEKIDETDVVVLTDANFDEKIKAAKFALVEFYAPWCGHCKNLAPHYAKAATALKAHDPSILIAKMDATAETKTAEKFSVQGYPTLKWFVDGKDTEYNGGREVEAIVRWVKKKTGPPCITAKTLDEWKAIEKENEVAVLGYFSAFEGKEYEAFQSAARVGEDVTYVETTLKEVAVAAGMAGDKTPAVIIVKKFEGYEREVVPLTKEISVGNLEDLVVAEKLPLVIPFIEKNQDKIFESGIDTHVLICSKPDQFDSKTDFMKMLLVVAAKFKGKMTFVSVNVDDEGAAEPVLSFFGVTKDKAPIIFGFQMEKNKKFTYGGKFEVGDLEKWCKDLAEGSIEPTYKTQEPPEVDEEDHVKIVVGKTVDHIVKDPTKDVLLEVYAPWCGHCKQLEPIYKKLGKRFSTVDSVIIAKMDGTENEHKDIEVSGFPSLFFFPATEGAEKISYEEGERTLLALTKFIKKHAKIPYELPTKKKEEEDKEEEEEAEADAGDEPDTGDEPDSDKTEL